LDLQRTALPLVSYNTNPDLGLPSASLGVSGNPNLKWEKSRQFNLGVDLSIKNNFITVSADYYRKLGIDLYGLTPYDYTVFGASGTITKNVANMKGKGVDLNLNINVFSGRRFTWAVNLLYNYNSSITTKYYSSSALTGSELIGQNGNKITPVVGKPLYSIAAFRWGGLNNAGNPQGYWNGHLSTDYNSILGTSSSIYNQGIVYVGQATPAQYGAFINRISLKRFSTSFNIAYKLGYYFVRPVFSDFELMAAGIGHSDYAKRWKKPGDENYTTVPAFLYPAPIGMDLQSRSGFYSNAEIHVKRADNIRFQYVNLNYSFSGSNKFKVPFQSLEVYINISDLGIIWKAYREENIDPDYPSSTPPSKSFTAGLRISF
jgi:hypothetical protein